MKKYKHKKLGWIVEEILHGYKRITPDKTYYYEKELIESGDDREEIKESVVPDSLEKIAEYLHVLRARRYVHQKYNMSDENYERREMQARTEYKSLSEEDKEKDRKLARELIEKAKPLL